MKVAKKQLELIFKELNERVDFINKERLVEGGLRVSKAEVRLLGQMSLLVNKKVSAILSLAQTADIDAQLDMDSVVKKELTSILKKYGLIYDEDSKLIWIPPGAKFEILFDLKNVVVKSIDPESALVSKAVKAPEKNKQLIREAIASGKFKTLIARIEKNGGKLEFFA
ncbi:MAG: hypothetical protein EB078_11295 [Proteobacteria bacterium]|nr:hypothetical protein [Pseudomonadota bacterium]NDD05483.1 hypothetical protein [Pseudomonadota bacterium]NDG26788.1 hypothetical protein [Pseudomonadota bacterium]